MGLFINKKQHPEVYKNKGALIEPNQVEYCINAFTEFVKDQKASNKNIKKAIEDINKNQDKYQLQQNRQWRELEHRVLELKRLHQQHEKVEKQFVSWLQRLENKQDGLQEMIQVDQQQNKEVLTQLQNLSTSQRELFNQLSRLDEAKMLINQQLELITSFRNEVIDQMQHVNVSNDLILTRIDEQIVLQHEVADKVTKLEETQQEVVNRVDGQEGIIDKIVHQIDHVRFILFERTNFLEERMEKLYQQAVSYFQKLKNTIKQPATVEVSSIEHEENKEL
ncbi:putative protein OS=Ureibacillus acetophenoni OX=614649 GN=SAMN05877842_10643 PE=4 SV=1 [Ureibacillus acetophenoni]